MSGTSVLVATCIHFLNLTDSIRSKQNYRTPRLTMFQVPLQAA